MSEKHKRPSHFPQKDWDEMTNIIANPTSDEAAEKAKSFKSSKDIDKYHLDLFINNNPNIPLNRINKEMLLNSILGMDKLPAANHVEDMHLSFPTWKLLDRYKTILKKNHKRILEENYNKLEKESQEALPQESQSIKDIIQKINNKAGKP